MKIAAIDVGTNSIHMVIAEATTLATFEVIDREREVVQIGRGSFAAGRLRAPAIRACVEALARFVELARRHQVDRILCTATAAVREARNGGDFLRTARQATGVAPRVIPAEEEGRLIYLAVQAALQLDGRPALIVDIGGGSTQLVVGTREKMLLATSVPLGALRLSESYALSAPPTDHELRDLRRHVRKSARAALARVLPLEPARVYGSSGSIHALAQVASWAETGSTIDHINGHVLSKASLIGVTRRLAAMTAAERERLPAIDAKRAEIILQGAVVLLHVLREVDADGITISDFGVREGLVTDYVSSHAEEITKLAPIADLRLRSVMGLLDKFKANGAHARHVSRLSLALFDGLRKVHGLSNEARELLHHAALLHDIGAAIAYDSHAEHSYYMIKNGNLRGFSADEVERVAAVARYHGKARPRKRDAAFRALPRRERRVIRWLAAMLRVAEGLDRSHYQLIQGLRVARRGDRLSILVTSAGATRLELWAARQRTGLLEQVTGARVRLTLEASPKAKAHPPPTEIGLAAHSKQRSRARRSARARAALPARSRGGEPRIRRPVPPLHGKRRAGTSPASRPAVPARRRHG